jgi:hypothetical protein
MILLIIISLALSFSSSTVFAQEETVTHNPFQIFEQVRNSTSFAIYAGSLISTDDIESLQSGNSLDRALLLYKRLKDIGIKVQLIQGKLRQEAISETLATAFQTSLEITENRVISNDPMLERLSELLSDHYWVRFSGDAKGYTNFDPTLPDREPGNIIANFRKVLKRLPTDVYQRLEITVSAEFKVNNARARSKLVKFVGPLYLDTVYAVDLFFVTKDINGNFVNTSEDPIYPVLSVNNSVQPAINLAEEAARIALSQGLSSAEIDLESVWLEMIYKCPGREDVIQTRLLHDSKNPSINDLGSITSLLILFPNRLKGEELISPDSLSNSIDAEWQPAFMSVFSESEKAEIADRVQGAAHLGNNILNGYAVGYQELRKETLSRLKINVKEIVPSPMILACYQNPSNGTLALDLVHAESNYYSLQLPRGVSVAANMLLGCLTSGFEGHLLNMILNPESDPISTFTLTNIENLTEWQLVNANNIQDISRLGLKRDAQKNLASALLSGKTAALPINGSRDYWWVLDPVNGSLTGMILPGYGGSIAQQVKRDADAWYFHRSSASENWGATLQKNLRIVESFQKIDYVKFGNEFVENNLPAAKAVVSSIVNSFKSIDGAGEFSAEEISTIISLIEGSYIHIEVNDIDANQPETSETEETNVGKPRN